MLPRGCGRRAILEARGEATSGRGEGWCSCGGATKSAAELELMARRYDLICTPAAAETNGLSSGTGGGESRGGAFRDTSRATPRPRAVWSGAPPLKPVSGPYASRRVHSSAFGGGDGAATSDERMERMRTF